MRRGSAILHAVPPSLAAWLLVCFLPSAAEPGPLPPVTALAFSPDGGFLASGGYKEISVWDMSSGKLLRRIGNLAGKVRALGFSPDGRTLAVAEGIPGRSGDMALVDFESGAPSTLARAQDEMLAVAFSPDGKLVAGGGTDGVARVWSVQGGDREGAEPKPVATLKGHTGWIIGLAFSPDGKLLATGSDDKTVRIWDAATWRQLVQLPQTPTDVVNGLAFAPEGDILVYAVGGQDERAIRIWRAANAFLEPDPARPAISLSMVQTRPVDTGTCLPLGVAWIGNPAGTKPNPQGQMPHSRMIVACADNTLRILGAAGNAMGTVTGHTDWVYAVAASPDGQRFASGSGDGTVRVWGAAGRLQATLGEEARK